MRSEDTRKSRPRLRRTLKRICASALVSYLIFLTLAFGGCTDRLILFPSTQPMDVAGMEHLTIPLEEGGSIEVWRTRSRGTRHTSPAAYVLVFTGNAARAELTAEFFAQDWGERPVEIWAVNYPGYGRSTGKARLHDIPQVALAAYDALRAHAGPAAPIMVEARSIGTTAALHVAANRPVAGCLLHNPPPLRALLLERYGWWNLRLLGGPLALTVPKELDSEKVAPRVDAPAVFLVAGADAVVPRKFQQRVINAYAGEKRVVQLEGADHTARASGASLVAYESAMDWLLAQRVAP